MKKIFLQFGIICNVDHGTGSESNQPLCKIDFSNSPMGANPPTC